MRRFDEAVLSGLDGLIGLESAEWPVSRSAYEECLLAVAIDCESQAGQASVYMWLTRPEAGLLPWYADRSEVWIDAVHDAVTRASGLLLRFRAGLDDRVRPNLRSMMRRTLSQ